MSQHPNDLYLRSSAQKDEANTPNNLRLRALVQKGIVVQEIDREEYGLVPIIVSEGKRTVLTIDLNHVNLVKELDIINKRIIPDLHKLIVETKRPPSQIIPLIIKRINVLIEGIRKSIQLKASEIEVSVRSSEVEIDTSSEVRSIE